MATIARRHFAREGSGFAELEDHRRPHPEDPEPRTWSCFAVFFPDADLIQIKTRIRGRGIDYVPSVKPLGVWVTGGHWWLQEALKAVAG